MHYSQTSRGVEGYAFNRSSAIWRFSSSWTLVISSLASRTLITNLWIYTSTGSFAGMASSEMQQQASSTTCNKCWFCDTNSSRCMLIFSIFIFSSLRIWITRLSLVCNSIFIPSYSRYNVSRGSAAKLRPRPFIMLTGNLSILFVATRAPSGNTIVFSICACNICSIAEDPTMRLVERVPTWGGHTCNSYSYSLRAPNTVWFSCIKSWRASFMTLHTISLMSCRSPSVKVIGSMANF